MSNIKNLLSNSLNNLIQNKVRSALTSLGIFIGITSVVLLNSVGLGFKSYIENQFKSIGSNLVMIMPGKAFSGGRLRATSTYQMNPIFDEKDALEIKKISSTQVVAPAFAKYLEIKGDRETRFYETIISDQEIFTVLNSEIDRGKLFNSSDVSKRNKIAVLGSAPAEKLYGSADNALGKSVKIDKQSYKIIGVLKSQGSTGGGLETIDDHIFVPYKAASSFNPRGNFLMIYAKTHDEENLEEYKKELTTLLLKRYNEDDFSVLDQRELLNTFNSIFGVVNKVLTSIATISLVVGGIGIMNIMFVTVVERIKEIGIRRSYGATRKDILYQFIMETIILSLLGCIFALVFSTVIVYLVRPYFPLYIDLNTVLLAVGVAFLIGLVFGVFPAIRAARLTPVEAIRRD